MRILPLLFVLVAACSSSPTPGAQPDLSASGDLAFKSNCGHPGDVGNSLGIGKFCEHQSDCRAGTLCTQLGDPNNFFCTKLCQSSDGGTSDCGESAHCACDSMGRGCGCFPDTCN